MAAKKKTNRGRGPRRGQSAIGDPRGSAADRKPRPRAAQRRPKKTSTGGGNDPPPSANDVGAPRPRTFSWSKIGWPLALVAVAVGVLLWQVQPTGATVPARLRVEVRGSHPHDRDAFTQGLLLHDGALYESTGRTRRSSIRRVRIADGHVEVQEDLADDLFGEGLARVGERFWQITWRNGKALLWEGRPFRKVREVEYDGEGWGLCYDGERLVMSDGTAWLTFRDPESFAVIGEVRVTRAGRPLRRLNELECVDHVVYANIWETNEIARIDPSNGEVTAMIDASGLLTAEERVGTDVLNGIAYVPETGRFLITGKLWPKIFDVEFVPAP